MIVMVAEHDSIVEVSRRGREPVVAALVSQLQWKAWLEMPS